MKPKAFSLFLFFDYLVLIGILGSTEVRKSNVFSAGRMYKVSYMIAVI